MDYFTQLFTDPALQALLYSVLIAFFAEFAIGTLSAIRNGTWSQALVGKFLQTQGTSVLMILVLAYLAGNLLTPLGVMASTAAVAYGISVQKSIRESLGTLLSGVPAVVTPAVAVPDVKTSAAGSKSATRK
jgi:alanine dehydrogenase